MQDTKSKSNEQENHCKNSIFNFFGQFDVNRILNQSQIKKIRGVKVKDILLRIMELPFLHKNFYQGIVANKDIGFNKSAAYDLLNNSGYNWRLFLIKIVVSIIRTFLNPLTSELREDVLIIDDTAHPRNRSKKVELLARVYDHVTHKYFKGFRILSMCWSDGVSLLPVDFALMSSNNPDNRHQEMNEKIDKRSCGYRRRKEAVGKSTELIAPMVRRAMKSGIKAKHLLMDSWFGLPSIIVSVKPMIDVVCRVKNTKKIHYYQNGSAYTLGQLYRGMKKRRGNAAIKGSALVELQHDGQAFEAKIVFVKNRNKKREWLGILSTDITLDDEEVVRIYGKRWDIEVFFKMMKQCLNLNGEVELRSYDGMISHITIVMLRYVFITVEQRKAADMRTFGGVYREMIDEMEDITIVQAFYRIMELAFNRLTEVTGFSKDIIDAILDIFMGIIIEKYHLKNNAA